MLSEPGQSLYLPNVGTALQRRTIHHYSNVNGLVSRSSGNSASSGRDMTISKPDKYENMQVYDPIDLLQHQRITIEGQSWRYFEHTSFCSVIFLVNQSFVGGDEDGLPQLRQRQPLVWYPLEHQRREMSEM